MAEEAISRPFSATQSGVLLGEPWHVIGPTVTMFSGGEKPLYGFRGRDSGVGAPNPTYVGWTGESPSTAYSGPLAFGGPVVDVIVWRIK